MSEETKETKEIKSTLVPILEKANRARTDKKRVEIIKENQCYELNTILHGAYDKKDFFNMPPGNPPDPMNIPEAVLKADKIAIDKKVIDLKAEYDNDYSRKREAEYPSIQECVHAILDDDLDALQKKRTEIKKKYPKG